MIDFANLQLEYEKMRKQKILEQQKIWLASDGRWKTYIEVAGKKKLVAKTTKEAVEKEVLDSFADPKVTFKDCFDGWISEKLAFGEIQQQTYDRYTADYKRYLKGTELEHKLVKKINELYLENFIKDKIAREHLTAKNWGNMRILISGAMVYARKHGYSEMRISLFLAELQLSHRAFRRVIPEDETQVFSRDEEARIKQYIRDNPDMMGLGVALAFYTGMRVGEVAALKWEDYHDNVLIVQRTEIKYKDAQGKWIEEVRDWTKGRDGIRQVVLTDKAIEILERLREITGEYEWMFVKHGERIKSAWLGNKIESICRRVKIPHRSFHKIRKTYATKLLNAGVGEKVIIKQLGHTEILTTKSFYYYNNAQVSEIKEQLQSVT